MLSGLLSGLHYVTLMLYLLPHCNRFCGTVLALQEICFYSYFHLLRTTELSLSLSITVSYQLWQFPFIYQPQVLIPTSIDMFDIV